MKSAPQRGCGSGIAVSLMERIYSEVTGKPLQDRLYRYMDDANLSISEMEPYFAYYPDKLYKNLVETRVIYKDMEEEILLEKKRGMAYKKLSLF